MPSLVMVVEDDQSIRESLQDVLELEGYQVAVAENGQAALDLLRGMSDLPKLILLDLMMPIKDGFEFRKEQQSDPQLNSIPVVIMSADGHVLEKKAKIGAMDYLKKPADLTVLLEVIQRYIPSM